MSKYREDDIRKYIVGTMTEDEQEAFETRIENDPELQDEIAFLIATKEAFRIVKQRGLKLKPDKRSTWKNENKLKNKWLWLLLVFAIIFGIVFYALFKKEQKIPYEKYNGFCIIVAKSKGINENFSATQNEADSLFNLGRKLYYGGEKNNKKILSIFNLAKKRCNELVTLDTNLDCCECQILYWEGMVYKRQKSWDKAESSFNQTIKFDNRGEIECQIRVEDAKKELQMLRKKK